jgi:thiol-disulfide isomerase/thioredoxin
MKRIYTTLAVFLLAAVSFADPVFSPAKSGIFLKDYSQAKLLSDQTDIKLVVIFTADWCKYCVILKEHIAQDPTMLSGSIFCYVDVEKHPDIASKYGVKTIPDTRVILKDKQLKKIVGYGNKLRYIEHIKNAK